MSKYDEFLKDSAKRRKRALALKDKGKKFSEIGAALGVSRARAFQMVKAERERIEKAAGVSL